jgi:hypothetical protein
MPHLFIGRLARLWDAGVDIDLLAAPLVPLATVATKGILVTPGLDPLQRLAVGTQRRKAK